jgi:glycosyltransferase involved in cell wall biosynthesis
VSVIVPARNEQACLATCLQSLVGQSGISREIIVVDDGSSDQTRAIAESFAGVQVVAPGALPPGWSGKTNAMVAGAKQALGEWLLFTDADTVHRPGSLARAVAELDRHGSDLLSYSPQQDVHSLIEKSVMPVIFAELASTFQPSQVSDPKSPAAAANGQYLLISRTAYDAVQGFSSVATSLLEDVALARTVKASGRKIVFRYAPDAVIARMYRSFSQLREGWTKNLVFLFPATFQLAVLRAVEFVLIVGCVALAAVGLVSGLKHTTVIAAIVAAVVYGVFMQRVRKAHFRWDCNLLALFGLPLFSYLLLRSRIFHSRGKVTWKGRVYASEVPPSPGGHPMNATESTPASL